MNILLPQVRAVYALGMLSTGVHKLGMLSTGVHNIV